MGRYAVDIVLGVALALWGACSAVAGEEEGGGSTAPAEPRIEGDREAARTLFEQAQAAYREGRNTEAADLFQQAYDAWRHPAFAYNRGQSLSRASRWQDALAAFQLYVSSFEASGLPRAEFDPIAYIQIAECQHRLGRRDEARESLQRYVEANPQGALAPEARRCAETGAEPSTIGQRDAQTVEAVDRIYDEAMALLERREYRQAAERFLEGYRQHADVTELLYGAAFAYDSGDLWEDAARTYEEYLRTPGAGPDAYVGLAQCWHGLANYERAVEAYRRYLEREPQGTFAQDAREYIDSMTAVLQTSVERRPSQETLSRARQHFDRATAHFAAGRYGEAIQEFSQTQDLFPSREVQYDIGVCYVRLRDWARALTQFENCLREGDTGSYAEAHLQAAECLIELVRWADAQNHIRDYLARADAEELPHEAAGRARAEQLMQRARETSGTGGSN